MLYYYLLYYTIYGVVLYCVILYYIMLYYIILYPYYTLLYCSVLYYTILYIILDLHDTWHGYELEALILPLLLMLQISFSIGIIEQIHGMHASIHRYHLDLTWVELCRRGLLSSCRTFFRQSPEIEQLIRGYEKLAMLHKKQQQNQRLQYVYLLAENWREGKH